LINKLELKKHFQKIKNVTLSQHFNMDENRLNYLTFRCDDLYLDASKNLINKETIDIYTKIANEISLKDKINNMFLGKKINITENRAVLHTALRDKDKKAVLLDGVDYRLEIESVYQKMFTFANKVINGEIVGVTNKKFKYVVNVGIGGSNLGVMMLDNALSHYNVSGIKNFFLSNIDSVNLDFILPQINLEETIFIIASKTFTTIETIENAKLLKKIVVEKLGESAINKHFVAISTNLKETSKFGINDSYVFGFWDFVGGRYSMWSAISLCLILSIGVDNFKEFLLGGSLMDEHFKNTDFDKNIPFMLAIIGDFYRNYYDFRSYAILPYSYNLKFLPSYLQQVDMESNGKYVSIENKQVDCSTGPVIFGEMGTDSQHSFFQLLHQGTDIIPCDLIGVLTPMNDNYYNHQILMANMFAQSEALMNGKTIEVVKEELKNKNFTEVEIDKIAVHKVFLGNRPTNTIVLEKLTPKSLGMLCSMYEHKVFVQGVLWNINSYDQWGVELGKELANKIMLDFESEGFVNKHDLSTASLIEMFKNKIKK